MYVHKDSAGLYLLPAVRINKLGPLTAPDLVLAAQLLDNTSAAATLSGLTLNFLGFELLNYGLLTATNSW